MRNICADTRAPPSANIVRAVRTVAVRLISVYLHAPMAAAGVGGRSCRRYPRRIHQSCASNRAHIESLIGEPFAVDDERRRVLVRIDGAGAPSWQTRASRSPNSPLASAMRQIFAKDKMCICVHAVYGGARSDARVHSARMNISNIYAFDSNFAKASEGANLQFK